MTAENEREREREREILLGALLWLRNHYDVGFPQLKEKVLTRVDKVLNDLEVKGRHAQVFREAYPLESRRSKSKKPLSWRTCPDCMSKATKIFSLNTGLLECQVCGHEYEHPCPKT